MVNPMQMQQVFLNLFMNAADALSKVTGRPRYLRIGSSQRRCRDRHPGGK